VSQIQISVFLFILGSCLGSFLNVVIYRIPRKMPIVRPPSRCPHCGSPIRPYDNVPILSFLILKGRCRSCLARISFQYPLVEAWAGLLLVGLYLKFGFTLALLVHALLCLSLVVVFFIDYYHTTIPDVITLSGIGLAIGQSFIPDGISPISSLVGIVAGGGALAAVAFLGRAAFRREAMGVGDIKLAAMVGGFLGWRLLFLSLFLASLLGALLGGVLILSKVRSKGSAIPFGPFIVFGSMASLFWGNRVIETYLSVFQGPH